MDEAKLDWWPKLEDYDPKISEAEWLELFKDRDIFNDNALEVMRCLLDYGGAATCKELAEAYGENYNFYNRNSSSLGERVHEKTGCPLCAEPPDKYWPILYDGKYAENKEDGHFIWRLRPELKSALTRMIVVKTKEMQLQG